MEDLTQGSTILQLARLKSWSEQGSNSRPHAQKTSMLTKEPASQVLILAIWSEEILLVMSEIREFSPLLQGSPSLLGQTRAHAANSTPWHGKPASTTGDARQSNHIGVTTKEDLTQGSTILQLARLKSGSMQGWNSRPHAWKTSAITKELASQVLILAVWSEEILQDMSKSLGFSLLLQYDATAFV